MDTYRKIVKWFKNLFSNKKQRKKSEWYLADTNVLFNNPEVMDDYKVVITSHVLREVEHLELTRKQDRTLQWHIRRFKRYLDKSEHIHVDLKDYKFDLRNDWDGQYTDNILVQICVEEGYGLLSYDKLLKDKCRLYGVEVVELDETDNFDEHKGYKEAFMFRDEVYAIYQNPHENTFDLIINEYLAIYDDTNTSSLSILDIFKWDGKSMISLPKNSQGNLDLSFKTHYFDRFTPKDAQQMMAVDSIMSNQITQIRGRAGSGKSKIALETAWSLIERVNKKEGYEKLVIFVNPTPTRDTQELGFYQGDKLAKLMQSSVGVMLGSKFGDIEGVIEQIAMKRLEILPLVDIRGYETGEKKVVVWILEAQNLTSESMKLALQRISENAKVIIDGDYHAQVDKDVYALDNGMKRTSEVFRGEDVYGEVELQNVYRSRVALIADKM